MSTGPAADGLDQVVTAARQVASHHVPDGGGWCVGCLRAWGRGVPHPCTQAEWAAAVLATVKGDEPARDT